MLAGNVVAIGFSGLVCVVVSLIKPQNYDWALMKEIPMIESDENAFIGAVSHAVSLTLVCDSQSCRLCHAPRARCHALLHEPVALSWQKLSIGGAAYTRLCVPVPPAAHGVHACVCCGVQDDPAGLARALKWTWMTGGVLTLVLVILW